MAARHLTGRAIEAANATKRISSHLCATLGAGLVIAGSVDEPGSVRAGDGRAARARGTQDGHGLDAMVAGRG